MCVENNTSGFPVPIRAITLGLRGSSARTWKSMLASWSRAVIRSATFRVSPGGLALFALRLLDVLGLLLRELA